VVIRERESTVKMDWCIYKGNNEQLDEQWDKVAPNLKDGSNAS